MKEIIWSKTKEEWLNLNRKVSLKEICELIVEEKIIDTINNPNQAKYPKQKMFIIMINNYIYVIPYFKKGNVIVLKTAYPSRKYNKIYKLKEAL